jgi:predicted RNA-binding protein with PIN domain
MATLIDGNNLLGTLAPGESRDRESRFRLVGKLLVFQRFTRRRIILVFDGPPDDDLEGRRLGPKFEVLFPPPGQKADDVIQERLNLPFDRRRFFVVSSDREVRTQARSRGAAVMKCEEFGRELKNVLKKARQDRELAKRPEFPTPLETSLWLDLFQRKKG